MQFMMHYSTFKRGCKKVAIPAVEYNGINGVWHDGKLYAPDASAIRAALPAYYRKAFDRSPNLWWNDQNKNTTKIYLTDARHNRLNTIYLIASFRKNNSKIG
jgi:hypothetical protein